MLITDHINLIGVAGQNRFAVPTMNRLPAPRYVSRMIAAYVNWPEGGG
jgi:hypothetical protein